MSVLLFIEHSVEVVHGKTTCKVWQKGYLRLGRSWGLWSGRGRCGESRCGEGPWLWADGLGLVALPLSFSATGLSSASRDLSPPKSLGVRTERKVLCKPNCLRKVTAGLS